MIKRTVIKKIIIASLALLILAITYIFPTHNSINQTLSYIEPSTTTIYLLDNSNMVSRTKMILNNDNNDIINKAKSIINALIINSDESKYTPNGFNAIIPEGTKINSISIDNNILKINFNDNFLKLKSENSEKAIEALIYSLTELDDIKGIGTKRKMNLLRHFKDIDGVKKASLEEILEVKGMNKNSALAVYEYFNK